MHHPAGRLARISNTDDGTDLDCKLDGDRPWSGHLAGTVAKTMADQGFLAWTDVLE
jgi:hypothetical protein